MQKRPFFSLLKPWWGGGAEHHSSGINNKQQAQQDHDDDSDTQYKMSLQHAHPMGPWQAISTAVKNHYIHWEAFQTTTTTKFRVLDLASGPRGQPGKTIASALPLAAIHITDFCPIAVEAISSPSLEENVTKSVVDLSDLSLFPSNTVNAISCCYGYAFASNISHALEEAHRVLVPGGVLVIASWERSAMMNSGRDILASVRAGGAQSSQHDDNDAAFLPQETIPILELSLPGELEAHLVRAGFQHNGAIVTTNGTYPFDLGNCRDQQFAMGTILVRQELESLGAFVPGDGSGGWRNLAEEAFWINIHKHTDLVDGFMWLRENTFKLTVSTKATTVL